MSSPGLSWMLRLATRADRRKQPPCATKQPPPRATWLSNRHNPSCCTPKKTTGFQSTTGRAADTAQSIYPSKKAKVIFFRHFAVRRWWILADRHIVKRGQTKSQTTSALAQPRLLWTNLKCFGRTTIEDFREPVQVKLAKQSDSKPNWCQHSRQATLNQVTNVKG